MENKKIYFMLAWNDNNGGSYTRSFATYEERAAFIPKISKRDWRGLLNYTVWERSTADTVTFFEK